MEHFKYLGCFTPKEIIYQKVCKLTVKLSLKRNTDKRIFKYI